MLTPRQRRDLLRVQRSRDAEAITDTINRALADNPNTDLLEIDVSRRRLDGVPGCHRRGDRGHRRHEKLDCRARPARRDTGTEPAGVGGRADLTATDAHARRPMRCTRNAPGGFWRDVEPLVAGLAQNVPADT